MHAAAHCPRLTHNTAFAAAPPPSDSIPSLFLLPIHCLPACPQIGTDGFTGLLHESEMRKEEGAAALKEGETLTLVVASIRGDKVALSQRSSEEINQVGAALTVAGGHEPLRLALLASGLAALRAVGACDMASDVWWRPHPLSLPHATCPPPPFLLPPPRPAGA